MGARGSSAYGRYVWSWEKGRRQHRQSLVSLARGGGCMGRRVVVLVVAGSMLVSAVILWCAGPVLKVRCGGVRIAAMEVHAGLLVMRKFLECCAAVE